MLGYLRVESGPDQGRIFNILEGMTLTIGRSQKSDTQLKDLSVSRMHCEVSASDGHLTLLDQEGSSGTFVNGAKINKHVLKSGDTIKIGDTQLIVHLAGIPDADTVAGAVKAPRTLQEAAAGLTGQYISHYEVGPMIAKGHTGTVYKAKDIRDGKTVALKILHHDFVDDPEDVQRFIRAINTAVDLKHPNLVAIQSAGKLGGLCWIAMEYVDGESLASFMKRHAIAGMIDWTYALHVAIQIAKGLEEAAKHHVVHRNISPSSILVTKSNPPVAKLGDIMLAKAFQGIKTQAITKPGEIVGDVTYMSPERTREDGGDDSRSDIYALGATLYLVLTGHPPFEGKSIVATLTKIRQEDPVPPKKYQLSIPDKFQDLVLCMMAKRKEDRPESPSVVVRDLERIAKFNGIVLK